MHHSQRKDQRLHCIDTIGMEHTLLIRPRDLIVAAKSASHSTGRLSRSRLRMPLPSSNRRSIKASVNPPDSFVLRLSRGPSFSTHTADSPDAYDAAAPTSTIAASGSPNCPRRRASADSVRHLNNKHAASPKGSGVLFDRDT
jgi:hypothetical protein